MAWYEAEEGCTHYSRLRLQRHGGKCVSVCVLLFTYTVYWSVCSSVILFLHLCVYTWAYMFVLLTHVKKCACAHLYMHLQPYARVRPFACLPRMCVTFLCLCVMFMHTCVYAPPDMCECVRLCAPMRMYKYICVCVCGSLRCASLAATH